MKAVLIGINKESLAFAKAIQKADNYPNNNGIEIDGILCRDISQTTKIAIMLNIKAYTSIDIALHNADILLVAYPDSKLGHFSEGMKLNRIRNKVLCHFSNVYDSTVLACGVTNSCYSIHLPYRFDSEKNADLANTMICVEGGGKKHDEFIGALQNSIKKLVICNKSEKRLTNITGRFLRQYIKIVINLSRHLFKIAGTYDEDCFDLMIKNISNECSADPDTIPKLSASEMRKNLRLLSTINYADTKEFVRNMEAYIVRNSQYDFEEKEELTRILSRNYR